MTYVLGFDISTVRVDCAAVPLHDQPRLGVNVQLTNVQVKGSPRNPAERCIHAGQAARECLHTMHARNLDIIAVAIEEPWGASRKGDRALLPILGSISAQLGAYPVQWWAPNDWRKTIGARPCNVKSEGHAEVWKAIDAMGDAPQLPGDALDAIGVALALRTFLLNAEEAA